MDSKRKWTRVHVCKATGLQEEQDIELRFKTSSKNYCSVVGMKLSDALTLQKKLNRFLKNNFKE